MQPDWDDTHGVEQTLRIARYVGADTKEPHLVYEVKEGDRGRLDKLNRMKVSAKPRLVLQLGGGRRASWRDWPVERYAELLRLASLKLEAGDFRARWRRSGPSAQGARPLFVGEPKPYHDVVGKLSLAESAALLASARALVSTDTGIMHLGFAVNTRVVALIHCNIRRAGLAPTDTAPRHRVVQLPRPANYRTPADANMGDITATTVFFEIAGDLGLGFHLYEFSRT